MKSLKFNLVDHALNRPEIVKLNIEYFNWISSKIESAFGTKITNLVGMSIPDYVDSVIDKVCSDKPPEGAFYLVEMNNETVGMVGFRKLRDGVAEIKRLYVCPAYRGRHIGQSCMQKILTDAKEFGYQSIFLDTAPFMYTAQRLYKSFGFKPCEPYSEVEAPHELRHVWVFMECNLNEATF